MEATGVPAEAEVVVTGPPATSSACVAMVVAPALAGTVAVAVALDIGTTPTPSSLTNWRDRAVTVASAAAAVRVGQLPVAAPAASAQAAVEGALTTLVQVGPLVVTVVKMPAPCRSRSPVQEAAGRV